MVKPIIELKPSWEIHRHWWIDLAVALVATAIIFTIAASIITYRFTRPWDIAYQQARDISHNVFKMCIKEWVPDAKKRGNELARITEGSGKCERIANQVLKNLVFKNEQKTK